MKIVRLAFGCAVLAATWAFADARPGADLGAATVAGGAALSRRAATEGIVLLKNDGTLPLNEGDRVAVFDLSGKYRSGGGGSSNVKPVRIVDIPSGLADAGLQVDSQSRETAVLVVGRASAESADAADKAFGLSPKERKTLDEIKAGGFRRIAVVCNCGHAIDLGPLARDPAIGAILWAWFPGGEGGAAIGDILTGKVNPSGRLASTFAGRVEDYPSNAKWRDSLYYVPYEEDVFVGYRYFETIPGAKEKVVYPFGHGLSYTSFSLEVLENLEVLDQLEIKVKVENTGKVAGKRSVLCYTSQKGGAAEHPSIELRAFAKTRLLQPGESEELMLSFEKRDLAYFDDEGTSGHPGAWVLDKGEYTVLVGGSVRDVKKVASFKMEKEVVLSTPGFKLQTDRLARRLRADGSYSETPVVYQGVTGKLKKNGFQDKAVETPTVTLFDVADGRATLDELLDQMTLQELLHLCYGHEKQDKAATGSIGALEKFGISAAQTCDGPAGVRRELPATYFPCAALLACAFDTALVEAIGERIGAEAAEADFDILLAPGLCIHRHPLCGRNFEYFSEDPVVSGRCAASYVRGVQNQGVGATIKHFAANNRETGRRVELNIISERAFREIYLRGFERAIKESAPWAVMSSYNGSNGFNSSVSHGLVTGILREEWGFEGVVMTDWHTSVPMWREIAAGNDVKMPDEHEMTLRANEGLSAAVKAVVVRDVLSVVQIRQSARRVCELVMKTRRFAREKVDFDKRRNAAGH
jgi:beta-glucosidase